eukprot:TRINITY_DN8960_c0_g1_i6.p1 TRINITY_DN8960_c0_g1~~TRINITY_DN8960_c0_g1_i6.p1  ORF type:complete len:140 (+),score=45.56 TRINITY_DN8960_c0_g1_i6:161-580(+)
MVSIWNLKDPLRTGFVKIARFGGREKFGTVVRAGLNDKTVSVLVEKWKWNRHYGKYLRSTSLIHCHDEINYCVVGDKVVIRSCDKLSRIKAYYVRNVVLPIGRNNCFLKRVSTEEMSAMKSNERLRANRLERYKCLDHI